MKHVTSTILGKSIVAYICNTVVVGSGASVLAIFEKTTDYMSSQSVYFIHSIERPTCMYTASEYSQSEMVETGGSELNVDQIEALGDSQYIALDYFGTALQQQVFLANIKGQIGHKIVFDAIFPVQKTIEVPILTIKKNFVAIMHHNCAHYRSIENIENATVELHATFRTQVPLQNMHGKVLPYRLENQCIMADDLVAPIKNYLKKGFRSRNAYFIARRKQNSREGRILDISNYIQEVRYEKDTYTIQRRQARPIPVRNLWFENVSKEYQGYGDN